MIRSNEFEPSNGTELIEPGSTVENLRYLDSPLDQIIQDVHAIDSQNVRSQDRDRILRDRLDQTGRLSDVRFPGEHQGVDQSE